MPRFLDSMYGAHAIMIIIIIVVMYCELYSIKLRPIVADHKEKTSQIKGRGSAVDTINTLSACAYPIQNNAILLSSSACTVSACHGHFKQAMEKESITGFPPMTFVVKKNIVVCAPAILERPSIL